MCWAQISDSELIPNIILLACTFNHLAGSTNTIGVLDLRINTNGWNFRGDQKEKASKVRVLFNDCDDEYTLKSVPSIYSSFLTRSGGRNFSLGHTLQLHLQIPQSS